MKLAISIALQKRCQLENEGAGNLFLHVLHAAGLTRFKEWARNNLSNWRSIFIRIQGV